jgi:hypothetical protein
MYRKEGKNNTKKKKKKGSAAAAAGGLRFHHPFSSTLMGFWPYTRQKKKKKSVRFPSLHSGANHVDLKRSVWEEHKIDKKK